jgi:superfamily II DNA or RNA helicase
MPNTTYEELEETRAQELPPPSLSALKKLREEQCSTSSSRDFKLQSNQRFLRRVMSPESNTRGVIIVHGTGSGKTCTAIQIAEEYIIRPEFQEKRVLVLANPSIQENFKTQIFDISRVTLDADGLLLSKQCTGRRYLEMLQRSQSEPLRYTDKGSQEKVMKQASKLIGEFYEFQGYTEFSNNIDRQKIVLKSTREMEAWIHKTFDNRLLIVDEAHNLRESSEDETVKLSAIALEQILKTANGLTLVLLTATPMYDRYDELLYYFNLFLWNERKMDLRESIKPSDIFTSEGEFKEGKESEFRGWCQEYVSFVKGENPFTFPFRLPPPDDVLAENDRTEDIYKEKIKTPLKHLILTKSIVSSLQEEAIIPLRVKAATQSELICVYPENKTFKETFSLGGESYVYKDESIKFLSPSQIKKYSSKFGLIMDILDSSKGVVFVYSNIVESGARLFSMCLEEHGYESALGNQLLGNTSGEIKKGSKGKYVLFTSATSDSDIKKAIIRSKRPENSDGSDIRIIVASPKVSEGVDFRFVRQIHVLDPWFNMSRIEQVLGRGMRTCSHSLLDFEEQNCTIYLHVCRYEDSTQETLDEYIYRTFVEEKAIKIAKIKKIVMESAMDCDLQYHVNNLPAGWKNDVQIPQTRSQDNKPLLLTLKDMTAPTFTEETEPISCKLTPSELDLDHERPLSAILDVKDEILDKLLKLFIKKPIWNKDDLYSTDILKSYKPKVLDYIIQNAIDTGFKLKDRNGRLGNLQSRKNIISFSINEDDTMLERSIKKSIGIEQELRKPEIKEPEPEVQKEEKAEITLEHKFPDFITERFAKDVLDWYIVDMILKPEDKIKYLLGLDWSAPPIYALPLLARDDEEEVELYILGLNKVYDEKHELITPVGGLKDLYNAWLEKAKERYIENKDSIFASVKNQTLIFNIDEKASEIQKADRSKNIGGRTCGVYKVGLLNKFSEWLVEDEFPPEVKTKDHRCLYLDLLVREVIIDEKEGIFWITPEEYEILNQPDNNADIRKRIKD